MCGVVIASVADLAGTGSASPASGTGRTHTARPRAHRSHARCAGHPAGWAKSAAGTAAAAAAVWGRGEKGSCWQRQPTALVHRSQPPLKNVRGRYGRSCSLDPTGSASVGLRAQCLACRRTPCPVTSLCLPLSSTVTPLLQYRLRIH